ncbi:hypothetical protein OFB61_23695, partial [Escherichia coli]|nr:hypothetical protein [Escherichia coli]
ADLGPERVNALAVFEEEVTEKTPVAAQLPESFQAVSTTDRVELKGHPDPFVTRRFRCAFCSLPRFSATRPMRLDLT